jgi:hypothetical protein
MAESPALTATALVVLIAVVIVAAVAGGVAVYYLSQPKVPAAPRVVAIGDNATVNYIGLFGSGPQTGRVFDTSLYSVASNNASFPKSLEFHSRGAAANYTPLAVHVGNGTPSGGYSLGGYTFVGVVTGFWQGLVGVAGNSSRSIVVPPALGYGPTNASCLLTLPLVQQIPVVETLSTANFSASYSGIAPATGLEFTDPHWGWPVVVMSANSTSVVLENLATVGQVANPQGWDVTVSGIATNGSGVAMITVVNDLTPGDSGLVLGHDYAGTGPCSAASHGQFIVSSVNPGNGTYTEDFNTEVTGQTLIFQVTVVDVFGPAVNSTGNATAAA